MRAGRRMFDELAEVLGRNEVPPKVVDELLEVMCRKNSQISQKRFKEKVLESLPWRQTSVGEVV